MNSKHGKSFTDNLILKNAHDLYRMNSKHGKKLFLAWLLYFQTEKYFFEHMIGGAAVKALELFTRTLQEQYRHL